MKRNKRILLTVIGIIAVILIILSLFANSIAKNKIEALLQNNIPEHIESSYEGISVNVLSGSVSVKNPSIHIKIKDSSLIQTKMLMKSFVIGGVSYWDYIFNDKIHIGKIKFKDLQVIQYKDHKNIPKDSTEKKEPFQIPKSLTIGKFIIENSSIKIIDNTKDSLYLSVENIKFKLLDIKLDSSTSVKTFKNNYKSIELSADSIFLKSGLYENLTIEHFDHSKNSASIIGLGLKTKYSEKELSKIIPKERDHFIINGGSLQFSDLNYGFENDTFFLKSSLLAIDKTVAEIYRDKLVADDFKVKKLYSKSLRELPINLTIDSVSVKNSSVIYKEKTHIERPPGILTISEIKANVSNLSNTYKSPEKTKILVDAVFMKSTPFHANWSFDVNNKKDEFEFVGDIGIIYGESLNSLLVPLINAKIDGEIDNTLFTIKGNYYNSMIYMSQKYENVKIEILNKKKKRNTVVSGIANAFVHNESSSDGTEYNHITTDATRNNTKSFFNYLIVNLKEALLVSFFERKNKKNTVHKVHIDHKKYREARLKKKKRKN